MKFAQIAGVGKKVYGERRIEESFSFPYKNVRRMVCSCGYEGICINETCKKCRQKTMVQIDETMVKTGKSVCSEVKNLIVNSDAILVTLLARKVVKNSKKHYLFNTTNVFLKFDTKSGELFANNVCITYQLEEKSEEPTTLLGEARGFDMDHVFNRFGGFMGRRINPPLLHYATFNNFEVPEPRRTVVNGSERPVISALKANLNLLEPFFLLCAKERNLEYTDIAELVTTEGGFEKLLVLLRLPVLEYAQELNINVLSKEIALELDGALHGKEVWEILIGHSGKAIKKIALQDVNTLNHLMRWGKWIKKQENLVKLASSFTFIRPFYNLYLSGNEAVQPRLFETRDEKVGKFSTGMRLLQRTHENETVWVNRLLEYKNNRKGIPKSEEEVYQYICDIGDMYAQVTSAFPDYTLKRTESIQAIHDELVKWQSKIGIPNVDFSISEKMKTWEEEPFVFAKTAHELSDVGLDLDICVGSYWQSVYSGARSIILLKENEEVKVCIELDRKFNVVQAKMYKNGQPTEDYRNKIFTWAKKHGLNIQTMDLNTGSHRAIRLFQHV